MSMAQQLMDFVPHNHCIHLGQWQRLATDKRKKKSGCRVGSLVMWRNWMGKKEVTVVVKVDGPKKKTLATDLGHKGERISGSQK